MMIIHGEKTKPIINQQIQFWNVDIENKAKKSTHLSFLSLSLSPLSLNPS